MSKKKVLLVDDSIATAKQLQKIVDETDGYEVAGHALNGIEGIKMFMSIRPDIVFMDIVMPEMDGLQAIRSIKNLDKEAKIVVISSAGGVGDKVTEALKFGAMNVIPKPFDPDRVRDILSSV
jgi:two-component system chemotaxis response regulator CheY